MATGPEHYREAELLLISCQLEGRVPGDAEQYPEREDGVDSIGNALAAAQVHATLALAAATALSHQSFRDGGTAMNYADLAKWADVASAAPGVVKG